MPWITPNGKTYKYCLLDTNIISEIVKNPEIEGKGFLTRFPSAAYVPCMSAYSLIELRRNGPVYTSFIEMFSIIPFFITKTLNVILEEEFKTYSTDKNINPVQVPITALSKDSQLHLKNALEKIFSDNEVLAAESRWRSDETTVLNSWKKRLNNFQQESSTANAKDAERYWEEAGLQTLMFLNPAWAKEKVDAGHLIDPNHFLSVKAMLYSQYYRLYDQHWKPRPQEITDIQIIAVSPYVDTVITEKFQAEIFKKIKTKVRGMEKLEIYTLRDIRI